MHDGIALKTVRVKVVRNATCVSSTRIIATAIVSKRFPKPRKSLSKSPGPIPKAAAAIEGSVKYLVSLSSTNS